MKVNDKVIITADWLPSSLRGRVRGTIIRIQNNGRPFYKLQWKHAEKYGDLFGAEELKPLDK